MNPQEYAEKVLQDIEGIVFYSTRYGERTTDELVPLAIHFIEGQIEVMDEWYYKKDYYQKAIEYLKTK